MQPRAGWGYIELMAGVCGSTVVAQSIRHMTSRGVVTIRLRDRCENGRGLIGALWVRIGLHGSQRCDLARTEVCLCITLAFIERRGRRGTVGCYCLV